MNDLADLLRQSGRALAARYRGVPSAILLPQVFLAFGWWRAGLAHGMDGAWWSGEELSAFLRTETDLAVGLYRPFLDFVIEPMPSFTAAVVWGLEIAIGIMLGLNIRPIVALLLGSFLNIHFMLAGVVSPSTFYLVIAFVIVLWRVEHSAPYSALRRLAKASAIIAVTAVVLLLPFVRSPSPAHAIEDPALVLIFLSLLFAGVARWASHRFVIDTPDLRGLPVERASSLNR